MNQKSESIKLSSRVTIITLTLAFGLCLMSICKAKQIFPLRSDNLSLQKRSVGKISVNPRSLNCSSPITPEMTLNVLLPINYHEDMLDKCLSDEVLKNNLTQLGNLAFSKGQLHILKNRLNKLEPDGLTEDIINKLGFIITVYSAEEMTKWKITNPDTLAAVLQNTPTPDLVGIIVSNYYQGPGVLNVTALNAIHGPLLCTANETKLRTILPADLRSAEQLDITTCTQPKKDILYNIAADQDQIGSQNFYNQTKPYLGGAPATDLQRLAAANVNMDIETFKKLNPVEAVKLSAQEVRDLLGVNLPKLNENESDPLVQAWIRTHSQADVRSLGVGLSGGRPSEQEFELGHFDFAEGKNSASSNNFGLLLSVLTGVITISTQRLL
ncbi:mesothelin-like protein [Callorhinchus milii]|uniref:Mesothelin-like protein n=1 Tax=Callorhinchus milii TaxID=7868 RepID=A0A4W3JNB3_CALMI|nr:mesothelin-like protein [Callorhinchus milii]|eukprot:gi/632975605/ref/XP_007904320.1/ PREDICTED: mesothelin-like protein [Callorhinchus milii]